jgi:hypothetical protein
VYALPDTPDAREDCEWLKTEVKAAGGIDRQAQFGFAADRESVPEHGVPFDMFGVEFSHQADGCTFETLCSVFGIAGPVLSRIAAIVHDLDLKDGRFGAPECSTVGSMIEGLQLAIRTTRFCSSRG